MNPIKKTLFKRQITMSEIGELGQQKLQDTAVLVVGCGGLGSPVAVQLAASGIGTVHLVDYDTVDLTNLHRQVFYSIADKGRLKAQTLASFIQKRAPFTEVTFETVPVTKQNVFRLISDVDVVVDATDSLPTKYLLNDACVIKNKPLIYGSLYKFDGYVASFHVKQSDGTYSANLRDVFPEMRTDIPNCEEAGTLNAIVSFIAAQQVNEVLKLILGIGKPLTNQLLVYNSLQNSQLKIKLTPENLSESKRQEKTLEIFDNETYFDVTCELQDMGLLISSEEFKAELTRENVEVISVIENLIAPFKLDRTFSMHNENLDLCQIDSSKKTVIVCQKGLTSYKAVKVLKKRFPKAVILSLAGGVNDY